MSLTDFDVVIINPEEVTRSFPPPSYRTKNGRDVIFGENKASLQELMEYRRSEVKSLLQSGKVIISFLTPCYGADLTVDSKYVSSLNNYSWLPESYDQRFVNSIVNSQGSVLKLVDNKNPFVKYYLAFKGEHAFSAYLNYTPSGYKFGKAFLSNSTGHITGFYTELLNDIVVFLPMYDFQGNLRDKFEGVLLDILSKHFGTGLPTAAPDWINGYKVPGTELLTAKIDDIDKQIQLLELDKSKVVANRNNLEEFKALLYEQGHILENKVVEALQLMGFNAKTVKAENTDYDVVLEAKEGRAIAEVEGKDDSAIHKEKIDQLLSAINQDGVARGEFSKGIMIGNHYRKKKPEDREFPFTDTVKNLATQYRYALLTTVDLYNAIIYILEHPDNEEYKTACRNAIFKADGNLVTFPNK